MNHLTDTARSVAIAGASSLVVGVGYLAPMLASPSLLGIAIAVLLGLCTALGVFVLRSVGRIGALMVVPSMIAALLVAMAVPLVKDGFPDVSIIATGQKNPKSKSSEVFVRLLSEPVQGKSDFEGEGWEKRDGVFVSYQKQPNMLYYRGAWSSGAALRFVRHAYSGIAEVVIGSKTQRLDLFSEEEAVMDLPLPEGSVSWHGHVQRAAIVVGLGMLFTAVGIALAGASAAWGFVFMLALLAGCGSLWLVKDRSYTGPMEVVAFGASSELVGVEMDAGHGFTQALVVPVKGGTSVETDFSTPNPIDWKLKVEGGSLRVFRDLDANVAGVASSGSDNSCAIFVTERCVYEVQGAGPFRVWLQAGSEQKALQLPAEAAGIERLFLLVERKPGRITVSASRAFVTLTPWENFSDKIVALRMVGQDGKAAEKLVRLQSDGMGSYQLAQRSTKNDAYWVPGLVRPDTNSFFMMKLFAGLIGASIVLLIAAAVKVTQTLMCCFCEGRQLQVVASVVGCIGWLGMGALIGWPAIIGWDGFSPYIQAQAGSISLWYGLGYPMIVGGFLLLGSGALVTAWSVFSTAVLLLSVAALLLRRGSNVTSWLAPVLMCIGLPFTAVTVGMMTHLRDSMNGLMLAMFSFCIFYTGMRWKLWLGAQRNTVLAGLLLYGSVLALLRMDNIPTLLVLTGGLAVYLRGLGLRTIALVTVAAACWVSVSAELEKFVIPDQDTAAKERRLYASTAVINPLTGFLVYGKGRIPDTLYTDIHDALDKVMDVDAATLRWSPYNIIYWHETNINRELPSLETSVRLWELYVHAFKADPVLFMKLRLATFSAILGHEWFEPDRYPKANGSGHPSFHDHLLSAEPYWRHHFELLGYKSTPHEFPEELRIFLQWEGRIASTALQLIICMVVLFRFRHSPLAAVLGLGEIVRAGIFLLLAPASVFFYLYDLHLMGLLLPMMAVAEQTDYTAGQTSKRKQ